MDKISMLFNLNTAFWNIGNSLLSFFRIPNEILSAGVRQRNINLKNAKKSDKCFIVGLGPSLSKVDFAKLDGDIIATNRYYKFDTEAKYPPSFYVIADKAFYLKNNRDEFENIINTYPCTCMVLNGLYKDYADIFMNDNMERYYFYMWKGKITNKRIDFSKIIPAVNNVIHVAIMLALYCGYKEIFLLGCDFNSFASDKSIHCYKEEDQSRLWSMYYELYAYSLAAYFHGELNKCAEKRGQHIINATRGSLLDTYSFDSKIMEKIYRY